MTATILDLCRLITHLETELMFTRNSYKQLLQITTSPTRSLPKLCISAQPTHDISPLQPSLLQENTPGISLDPVLIPQTIPTFQCISTGTMSISPLPQTIDPINSHSLPCHHNALVSGELEKPTTCDITFPPIQIEPSLKTEGHIPDCTSLECGHIREFCSTYGFVESHDTNESIFVHSSVIPSIMFTEYEDLLRTLPVIFERSFDERRQKWYVKHLQFCIPGSELHALYFPT